MLRHLAVWAYLLEAASRPVALREALLTCCRLDMMEAVNYDDRTDEGFTPINRACFADFESVKMLLWFPRTDVNFRAARGHSACAHAAMYGKTEALRLLLKHAALELDADALRFAVHVGELLAVKMLLASGRDLRMNESDSRGRTALYIAKEFQKEAAVTALLEAYIASPVSVTKQLRAELEVDEQDAADLFALCVFVSDGLLQVRPESNESAAARYLTMAALLPPELQMVLALRTFGSSRDLIQGKYREEALRFTGQRGALEDEWEDACWEKYLKR